MMKPPTPDEVNALPEHIRHFIMELETFADPSGIIRENMLARDTVAGLGVMLDETTPALGWSAEVPTEPGWYWFSTVEKPGRALMVYKDGSAACLHCLRSAQTIYKGALRWAGPIPQPEPPTE